MSEATPTTTEVRERFVDGFPMDTWAVSRATCGAQFDRWLAEHDHAVLVEYEKRRKPDPIHIDNIDGLHAATWLAEHDARLLEDLAAEAATSFGWLDPDDAGRASRWIASRAAKRRKGAGQ